MKLIKNIFRIKIYLLLLILISFIFYLKKGHEYFSVVNYFKEDISQALSLSLDKKIKITQINEKWDGNLNFLANIEKVEIENKSLVLKNIDLEINIIDSIKEKKIILEKLIINRPEMIMEYNKDKENWGIKGFEFESQEGVDSKITLEDFDILKNLKLEFKDLILKTINKETKEKNLVLFEKTTLSLVGKKIYFKSKNKNVVIEGGYSLNNKELTVVTKGTYFDLENLMKKTPLIEYHEYINRDWLISADVEFFIGINFNDLNSYDIEIDIKKGKLLLKEIEDLYLSNISGKIYINEKDILKGKFKTKLYGNHINVDLKLLENNDIEINSYGYSNIKKINDVWLKNNLLKNFSGGSIFKTKITLGEKNKIKLESQLKGIDSNIPYPFNKTKEEKRNFIFTQDFDTGNTFVHYDKHNIKVNFFDNQIHQVLIGFNKLTPKEKDKGIFIEGEIDKINSEEVFDYLDKKFSITEIKKEKHDNKHLDLKKINIKVKELHYKDNIFNDSNIILNKEEVYKINLESNEVDLKLNIEDSGYYELFINKINMDYEEKIKTKKSEEIDLSFLSNGYIYIDNINIFDEQYFDVEIELPKTEQFTFNIFSKYKDTIISGNLIYDKDKNKTFFRGNSDNSTLIKGKNIYELRERSNAKYPFKSDNYNINLNINWLGSPLDFNVETLKGILQFEMNNLIIKNIKENYLSIKIFNIFNLNNIFEYLTFDFDSIDSQKVKFKKIKGFYNINNGIMETNSFKLEGKDLKIKMKGKVNLIEETVNKRLYIEAPITDKVPLLSFLAGATPQTAGILFIVEKVIGDEVNKMFEIKMDINGKWDDIQVKK